MNRLSLVLLLVPFSLLGQKKPLDHTVYDNWQSIGEKVISNDGKWVVFTVTPQEGDAVLFVRSTNEPRAYQKELPRGYNARITEDNRYVVFKIKPPFAPKEALYAGEDKDRSPMIAIHSLSAQDSPSLFYHYDY